MNFNFLIGPAVFVIGFLALNSVVFAQSSSAHSSLLISKSENFSGARPTSTPPSIETPSSGKENIDWRLSVGAAYVNQISKRGLITYGSDQFLPVISLNLGSPQLFLSGTSLNYKMTPNESLILRLRLNPNSTYDSPFYQSKEDINDRPKRQRTTEFDFFWEWSILKHLELNGGISQDLSAHKGQFLDVGFRFILGVFYQGLIEPAFFINFGQGTEAHNQYLYGSGAEGGKAVQSVGFSVAAPTKVDAFYPILKITRSWLDRSNLGSAQYVRTNEFDNWQLLIWGAVRVW